MDRYWSESPRSGHQEHPDHHGQEGEQPDHGQPQGRTVGTDLQKQPRGRPVERGTRTLQQEGDVGEDEQRQEQVDEACGKRTRVGLEGEHLPESPALGEPARLVRPAGQLIEPPQVNR